LKSKSEIQSVFTQNRHYFPQNFGEKLLVKNIKIKIEMPGAFDLICHSFSNVLSWNNVGFGYFAR
jgi:hypothetical protein